MVSDDFVVCGAFVADNYIVRFCAYSTETTKAFLQILLEVSGAGDIPNGILSQRFFP
ncbi:hypothetical protein DPMN_010237 [Dreissena polymorpha]|uniref:Uncharacterized protein n=1 Tax=Dreissena polymorpha TaxID=45954 RepID=A0A9D4N162_DREPO|nr:hypothetical protein DPMN_010237 [Dreissena polymorpha]